MADMSESVAYKIGYYARMRDLSLNEARTDLVIRSLLGAGGGDADMEGRIFHYGYAAATEIAFQQQLNDLKADLVRIGVLVAPVERMVYDV